MRDFLFKLLGAGGPDAGDVMGWHLQFQPVLGWPVGVLVVLGAAGLGLWSYLRPGVSLSPVRRRWLAVLRVAALVGISLVLLRPSLGLVIEGTVRQSLALLFDESASLALRDPRNLAADQVRAAIAGGGVPVAGGILQKAPAMGRVAPMRVDLLRAVLTNRELALIDNLQRHFDLKAAGFAGELLPLDVGGESSTNRDPTRADVPVISGAAIARALKSDGRESAPGSALREVLERERGRRLGGVVVFTDGIRNAGADPREAIAMAREVGVPVHFVGLGTPAPRDLQVAEISAQDVAFVRDEVAVTVRLRARGMTGETARVTLSLAGTTIESRDVKLESDGEVVLSMKVTPEITGDFELAAEVPARTDEILAENNRSARRLRVMDDRIRVLLLEQSARWEFRYLQALLLRDRRVDLKCLLFDGDPAIARDPGSPYLDSFPSRREDLFGYDLVVFGDVDPKHFTPAQLELLAEFVSRSGGSFLMLAGRRFSPWNYRDTALERLLPVEFDRLAGEAPGAAVHDRPVTLVLTAEGRASPLLKLSENPTEGLQRWEQLPPLYWIAPVRRAKPAAEVLVTGVAAAEGAVPIPVVAMQQYGVGQSMFIGTDNTWRWRRNEGEKFFTSFWGRVVQRLAIQHLLSGSRRTQISLDRAAVMKGERLGVTVRVFNNAFEPVVDPLVVARIESDTVAARTNLSGAGRELLLRAVPDQPGVFRGELVGGLPGRYRLVVGGEAAAAADFSVEDRWVEVGETALQEATMREWAGAAGGSFFREEDLHRLAEAVQGRAQRVQSRLVVEFWSSPIYFLLILTMLGAEWALRKMWQLK